MSNNPGRKNPLLQAERADRNRKIFIQVAVAAVLIGLVAAIGIGIAIKKAEKDDPGPTPSIAAAQAPGAVIGSITDNGSIRVGKPEAKVTVRVVADLQCPACKAFEAAYGKVLDDAVNTGTAVVEYNIISFLDKASTTQYSTRAANASYCVAQEDPTKYQAWLTAMFAQQPPEGGNGLPDEKLIEIAKSAGYSDAVASCITDRTYEKFVADTTNKAFDSGIQSTPTVFVDGKQVNPSTLEQAIAAAAAGQ
ncbi:DsbA family protein [Nocardia lijiangensis]|uniref:DsbA family protein n=1 Tax=Nocardia lijiangensis TaxID=299618 RepID=UPI003D74FEC2